MLRKRENEKWPYHSYQWLFLYVRGGLRKGKRKQASQDRNGYLSRGLLGKKAPTRRSPELSHRFCRMCGGQSGHDKRTSRVPSCPPEVLAFSLTFLSPPPPPPPPAPLPSEGGNPSARLGYKTQAALFKTGCLSEASFPSNKQSAKT